MAIQPTPTKGVMGVKGLGEGFRGYIRMMEKEMETTIL